MYNKILNTETGRMVSVNGRIGRRIIGNYVRFLSGGSNRDDNDPSINLGDTIENFEQLKNILPNDRYDALVDVYHRTANGVWQLNGEWRVLNDEWDEDEKKVWVFEYDDHGDQIDDLCVKLEKEHSDYKLVLKGLVE